MYGMFGFVEKLNIQNKKNLNEKLCTLCVHNIQISLKIQYLELVKFKGKLCTLDVRIVWISKKIEYQELV